MLRVFTKHDQTGEGLALPRPIERFLVEPHV
jgi:hypothetical protein